MSGQEATLQPVVLAGGSGTRLWPLSRQDFPKQFLSLGKEERTLFQQTLARLEGVPGAASPLVVCNEAHRFVALEQMQSVGRSARAVLLEPAGRNTAPALCLAALAMDSLGEDGDPVLLAMPADQGVRNLQTFREAVRRGLPLAEAGHTVTFGIVPAGPDTRFGYIRAGQPIGGGNGVREVAGFVEKPGPEAAARFVESGDYMWNGGIFMVRRSVWLEAVNRYRPDILAACRRASRSLSRDGPFLRPVPEEFEACPSDSIDYAVMERAVQPSADGGQGGGIPCAVVPLEAGWSDVGAWSAFWEAGEKDSAGNVAMGDVYLQSVRDALVVAEHRLVAVVGLERVVVVETPDAVLVAHRERTQEVGELVARLRSDGRREQQHHRRVHRPWGSYETLEQGKGFQVKRLRVKPGAALSLQRHQHRAEHWVVVSGTARVTRNGEVVSLSANQSTYIPPGATHRLANPSPEPLEVIEVQTGEYLGEDDIVRLSDDYGRVERVPEG